MQPYEDIGVRLEEERKKLGLSAIEVYSELDIAQSTYRNYEKGIRDIPASLLQKLWNHNFDILYIVTGTYFEEPTSSITTDDRNSNRLIQLPQNLDDSAISAKTVTILNAIEDGLLKAGAKPNVDYTFKDLVGLAQNIQSTKD